MIPIFPSPKNRRLLHACKLRIVYGPFTDKGRNSVTYCTAWQGYHSSHEHYELQKEVVDRICAVPGSKKYGRLSVMMQYYCLPELLFEVPPESFDPIPQVMSTTVRLVPQRRKTLRNSLKNLIAEEDIAAGIDPTLRAESISLAEFARLSNLLQDL